MTMPTGPREMNLELNGCQVSIKESGKGFPIVLIHTWHPYAKHLLETLPEDTYRIITFDTPGYYSKASGNVVTNLKDLGDLLNCLFDRLGFEKVDLLGQCLGGVIALDFAARYPERVRNLIIVTPPLLCYKPEVNKVLRTIFSLLDRNGIAKFLTSRFIIRQQLLKGITELFGGYKGLADIFVQEFSLVGRTKFNPDVFFGLLSSAFKLDLRETIGRIKARTVFVSGGKDIMVKNGKLKELAKKMQNVSFKVIPSAKHAIVIKNTGELTEAILPLLCSQHPGPRPNKQNRNRQPKRNRV